MVGKGFLANMMLCRATVVAVGVAILPSTSSELMAQSGILGTDQMAGGFTFVLGRDAEMYSLFECTFVDYSADSTVEYCFAPFVGLSGAKVGGNPRYGFKGPVNAAMFAVNVLVSRYVLGVKTRSGKAPARYLLFLPNSAVNLRVERNLKFTLATTTEYLFYRLHSGERGILFTPQIGLTLSGGRSPDFWNGLILSLGYTTFWNFDGEDRSPGFSVRFTFMITDIPH
jgi:hypothetical protein